MTASTPAKTIVATILGCGSSAGVPRIGNDWGTCDPANPRNRRRRCALLLTGSSPGAGAPTQILIDTGCDIREQLLDAGVDHLDAVFYTHEHADHTHGIDDLRALALSGHRRIDVYFSGRTGAHIKSAFSYCFARAQEGFYPPILKDHGVEAGDTITIEGAGGAISVTAFSQDHGGIESLGYRVANFAYSCDVSGIPDTSLPAVSKLDMWVLDALRPRSHPSHFGLSDALEWTERMTPKQAVLTNLHIDMDYATVTAQTPGHVTPAFDGMRIDVLTGRILTP